MKKGSMNYSLSTNINRLIIGLSSPKTFTQCNIIVASHFGLCKDLHYSSVFRGRASQYLRPRKQNMYIKYIQKVDGKYSLNEMGIKRFTTLKLYHNNNDFNNVRREIDYVLANNNRA